MATLHETSLTCARDKVQVDLVVDLPKFICMAVVEVSTGTKCTNFKYNMIRYKSIVKQVDYKDIMKMDAKKLNPKLWKNNHEDRNSDANTVE